MPLDECFNEVNLAPQLHALRPPRHLRIQYLHITKEFRHDVGICWDWVEIKSEELRKNMVERKSWHWPIGLQKTYDSSSNFWEPRCCPNWAKSCRRKPGNEAWASKASIEQTSKSLFWSSSHRPNGTKWLSESQVLSGNKKWKEKKVLLSESACAKASRSRHLEPTPWRNRCLCVCYPPSYEIICQAKSSGNIYTCGV